MAGEESEEEAMPGIHGDDDGEMAEMHGDMHTGEMEGMDHDGKYKMKHSMEDMYEEDEKEAEEVDEDSEIVREYVEKVADHGQKSESGKEAGAQGSANVNKSSTVAGKNDMGGTSANTAKGGAEVAPDGTSPKAAVKPKGQLINDPLNKPGARAGQAYAKKESAVNKEEGAVNKTTPVAK